LPLSVATVLAKDLDLQVITPPVKLPKIDIYQYWHDRLHRDPGNQWIRSIFKALFSRSSVGAR
jgi:DNA-binding transcriptional LysR family regulator